MTEAVLRFPGQLPDLAPGRRPDVAAGGCELGGVSCTRPAELEVSLPDVNSVRRLCREHVGYFMLGAAHHERTARVLVRLLGPIEAEAWGTRIGA